MKFTFPNSGAFKTCKKEYLIAHFYNIMELLYIKNVANETISLAVYIYVIHIYKYMYISTYTVYNVVGFRHS